MKTKNSFFAMLITLSAPAVLLAQVPTLPSDMHAMLLQSVEHVFNENFRGAEDEARKLMRAHPDHPVGYFVMAAALDAWMLRYQSSRRETEFFRNCDLAIEKAEAILAANPRDEWARFFMAGAHGYKGTYEARYERYITAFRHGWTGVSIMQQMAREGSQIPDIQFGIGTYNYWRSALTRLLWWMPGVPDNRNEGIRQLRLVVNTGVYTRTAAAMVLIEIYNNEKRFQEALTLANDMSRRHPRALVFMWGRATALEGLNRHEEAIVVYRQILTRVEADANNTHFNSLQARLGLARNLAALGRNAEAVEHLQAMNNYTLTREIQRRASGMMSDATSLGRRLNRHGNRSEVVVEQRDAAPVSD